MILATGSDDELANAEIGINRSARIQRREPFIVVIVPDEDSRALSGRNDFDPACRLLVERYVAGRELTCGVLGEEPLAVTEIRPNEGFYDFTTGICPRGHVAMIDD